MRIKSNLYGLIFTACLAVGLLYTTNCYAQVGAIKNLKNKTQHLNNISKSVRPGDPWTIKNIITPKKLEHELKYKSKNRPIVLQTGFSILYKQGHIKGSKYTGPASRVEGIKKLKKVAEKIPRKKEVVIYCGCCGWTDCPNIHPAFKTLKNMGFKNLKVLYLPHNFTKDWVNKGLPVEK